MTRKTSYPPLHHRSYETWTPFEDGVDDGMGEHIRREATGQWWRGLIRAAVTLLVLGLSFYAGTVAFAALSCQ